MKNIENKIKQIIDHQHETPPSFIWDNIEADLNKKRRRGFYIFGITLGLIGLLFLLQQNIFTASSGSQISHLSQSTQSLEKTNQALIIKQQIKATTYQIQEKSSNNKLIDQEKKSRHIHTNNGPSKNGILNSLQSSFLPTTKSQYSDDSKSTMTSRRDKTSKSSIKSIIDQAIKIKEIQHFNFNKNVTFPKIALLTAIINLPSNKLPEVTIPNYPNHYQVQRIKVLKKKIKYFSELGIVSGQHYTSLNIENNQELAKIRQRTEHSWFTWGTFVHAGIIFRNNFYLGTGFELIQSKDKFFNQLVGVTKLLSNNSNLAINKRLNSGTLTQTGEIKYTMIDIPVLIGYTKNIFDQWEIGFEMSANFNTYFKVTGQSLNEYNELTQLAEKTDIYKRRVGIGYNGSLIISHRVGNGISWRIKPTFKTYFNHITQQKYDLPTTYKSLYLSMGIQKTL